MNLDSQTSIEDFIFIRDYSVSSQHCRELIKFFEDNPKLHHKGETGDGKGKTSTDITIGPEHSKLPKYQKILGPFMEALTVGNEDYIKHYSVSLDRISRFSLYQFFNIQAYKVGERFYGWHSESSSKRTAGRKLVWMFYLNDVPSGGTEFLNQNLTTEALEGRLVIWPADWTHTHRGQEGAKIKKYILTGWMTFD